MSKPITASRGQAARPIASKTPVIVTSAFEVKGATKDQTEKVDQRAIAAAAWKVHAHEQFQARAKDQQLRQVIPSNPGETTCLTLPGPQPPPHPQPQPCPCKEESDSESEEEECKKKKPCIKPIDIDQVPSKLTASIQVPDANALATGAFQIQTQQTGIATGVVGEVSLVAAPTNPVLPPGSLFELGALSEILSFISADGGLIYAVYESAPNVGPPLTATAPVAQAELFRVSNNGSKLTTIGVVNPDLFALGGESLVTAPPPLNLGTGLGGTDTGGVSDDFQFFSIIDDDTDGPLNPPPPPPTTVQPFGNLRLRVYDFAGFTSSPAAPLGTVIFTDFIRASGSANGVDITPVLSDGNRYLVFNYISPTTGPLLKVIPLSLFSGGNTIYNPAVPTIVIPGFSNGEKIAVIGGVLYIVLGFTNIVNFENPTPEPPFGFNIYAFTPNRQNPSNGSLVLVNGSSVNPNFLLASTPNVDILKIGKDKLKIVSGAGQAFSTTAVSPIVQGLRPPEVVPVVPDNNNLQVFLFRASSNTLTKVFSTNLEGSLFPSWIPASRGGAIQLIQRISANLEVNSAANTSPSPFVTNPVASVVPPSGYDAATNSQTQVLSAFIFNLRSGERSQVRSIPSFGAVGTVHILPFLVNGPAISADSNWFVIGGVIQTPIGTDVLPSFGFPTAAGTVGTEASLAAAGVIFGPQVQPPPYPVVLGFDRPTTTGVNTLLLYSQSYPTA